MTTNLNSKTFDELYRKVNIVTNIRYISARRFRFNQQLSQWTITFISLLLILIPLLQALDMTLRHDQKLFDVVSVFLAILVLVYSLLISMENYSVRAEKMQNCGTELSNLTRDIYPYLGAKHHKNHYNNFSVRYQNILEKYENHDSIDYKKYTIEKDWNKYYKNIGHYIFAWLIINFQYCLYFWHYGLVSLGTISIIYYLFN